MDDSADGSDKVSHRKARAAAWMRALRPAMPAVIGAAALTFLFAAVMPMAWVFGIGWNLYLDRLSDLFVPPVGNGARLALALGMALVAALVAAFVALLIAEPEASGLAALGRRLRRRQEAVDDDIPVRRRADLHPDDLPRAPLRAGRDLPEQGLGPVDAAPEVAADYLPEYEPDALAGADVVEDADAVEIVEAAVAPYTPRAADAAPDEGDELILADLAPVEVETPGDEPWLQPAKVAGPAMPDPADKSLGAMVARFEAGLARRRETRTATAAVPVPDVAANEDADEEIDFALEAALSTLHRLNRGTTG
ncbi:hypothetical protein [Sphingopyxis sp. A083]|uniref:hypothetical protein n=1 Tax=Sphingopyxis sp. A083 TaxID=1759083 RepID=UPI000736996B|nr:hypothetical protein [Sphingopyxis sp. A083]KTE76046.1 hypothetical protein ATE59_11140 [Sphingopyxis sp. A083]